jgi:uncharacterized SAM-binding protein YcdF (DUF218 family)
VLAVLFVGATARLFVFPARDAPAHADAIVMLEGNGDRRASAFALARAGYAPVLVVSTPGTKRCPAGVAPKVRIICFVPRPVSTQGEARATAALAKRYGWRTVLVVAGRAQDTRARIRLERCYHGRILMTTVTPGLGNWLYAIAYEWGALVKAEAWQRTC